jgi:hypothetical protein
MPERDGFDTAILMKQQFDALSLIALLLGAAYICLCFFLLMPIAFYFFYL